VSDNPPAGVPLIAPTGAVGFSSTGSGTFTGTHAGTCALAAGAIAGIATCSLLPFVEVFAHEPRGWERVWQASLSDNVKCLASGSLALNANRCFPELYA
jgi:hypothetical protein